MTPIPTLATPWHSASGGHLNALVSQRPRRHSRGHAVTAIVATSPSVTPSDSGGRPGSLGHSVTRARGPGYASVDGGPVTLHWRSWLCAHEASGHTAGARLEPSAGRAHAG